MFTVTIAKKDGRKIVRRFRDGRKAAWYVQDNRRERMADTTAMSIATKLGVRVLDADGRVVCFIAKDLKK